MTDIVTKEKRSSMMAAVRQKDTKPEMNLRRSLHRVGLRYRLHRRDLPGTPDLVFPSARMAVFVHGCFWHRHEGCRRASTPAVRADFWNDKFAKNVARDAAAIAALKNEGWGVKVVWECELTSREAADATANSLAAQLSEKKLEKFQRT